MLDAFRRFAFSLVSTLSALAALCFTPLQVWAQNAPSPVSSAATASGVNGEVRNMVLKGDSIEVTYKNTGALPTAIVGELQVHVTEDEVVSSVVFADAMVIKAGATQRFRIAIPKLAKGKYTLVAIVDYGGEQMTAAMASLDMR